MATRGWSFLKASLPNPLVHRSGFMCLKTIKGVKYEYNLTANILKKIHTDDL